MTLTVSNKVLCSLLCFCQLRSSSTLTKTSKKVVWPKRYKSLFWLRAMNAIVQRRLIQWNTGLIYLQVRSEKVHCQLLVVGPERLDKSCKIIAPTITTSLVNLETCLKSCWEIQMWLFPTLRLMTKSKLIWKSLAVLCFCLMFLFLLLST